MTARLLDGKLVAQKIKQEASEMAVYLTEHGTRPGLAAVLVGNNPASKTYVGSKVRTCSELGLYSQKIELPIETTTTELLAVVRDLNASPQIHGILVQMPLPKQIDSEEVIRAIDPAKDVDGFHPINVGKLVLKQSGFVACTPAGIIEMLKFYDIPLRGRRALVLGRSHIVGLPMSLLLLHRDATVTIGHSRTEHPAKLAQECDVLVAAIGRAAFVTEEFIRPGATVIDVGINQATTVEAVKDLFGEDPQRLADLQKKGYTLVGDVHPRYAMERAGDFTPVPGGVGPLTIAMLMRNTVRAAERLHQN